MDFSGRPCCLFGPCVQGVSLWRCINLIGFFTAFAFCQACWGLKGLFHQPTPFVVFPVLHACFVFVLVLARGNLHFCSFGPLLCSVLCCHGCLSPGSRRLPGSPFFPLRLWYCKSLLPSGCFNSPLFHLAVPLFALLYDFLSQFSLLP